jgi:predicted RNase H-like HicB family nuclease
MKKQVLDYTVLIEQDEDGIYVAKVPEIAGCYTQGKDIQEVLERIKEAIEVCLESDNDDSPPMRFIGIQKVQVERPLKI